MSIQNLDEVRKVPKRLPLRRTVRSTRNDKFVAGAVSTAKIRFAPWGVNRSQHPQPNEVTMGMMKKLVASIVRLNPAGAWSAAR